MFTVHITREAERDINGALDYLLAQDAFQAAADLWAEFEKAFTSLGKFPLRGHIPPELVEFPDKRIREIHASVYRIIYRVVENQVYILFVVDGRRNIQSALLDRALRFNQ